jgi:hypothetical protein
MASKFHSTETVEAHELHQCYQQSLEANIRFMDLIRRTGERKLLDELNVLRTKIAELEAALQMQRQANAEGAVKKAKIASAEELVAYPNLDPTPPDLDDCVLVSEDTVPSPPGLTHPALSPDPIRGRNRLIQIHTCETESSDQPCSQVTVFFSPSRGSQSHRRECTATDW